MINQLFLKDMLVFFFRHQLTIKLYHFQTECYGAHKASDNYLDKFTGNLDRFMEVGQGIVGKIDISEIDLKIKSHQDSNIQDCLDRFITVLNNLGKMIPENSDLLTIRDEMLADANQFKYLLKFK